MLEMMRSELMFVVDAFTSKVFGGNPAAVVPLPQWLSDDVMQSVAAENNLSETAFFVERDGVYHLRWFTPRFEVNLCGHATLASAFTIFTQLGFGGDVITFDTRSGRLEVRRSGNRLEMNFPAFPPQPVDDVPADLLLGLGGAPESVLMGGEDYIAVFTEESQVRDLQPDLARLEEIEGRGVAITAP